MWGTIWSKHEVSLKWKPMQDLHYVISAKKGDYKNAKTQNETLYSLKWKTKCYHTTALLNVNVFCLFQSVAHVYVNIFGAESVQNIDFEKKVRLSRQIWLCSFMFCVVCNNYVIKRIQLGTNPTTLPPKKVYDNFRGLTSWIQKYSFSASGLQVALGTS